MAGRDKMVARDRIIAALDACLDVGNFEDYAPVGLQVEGNPTVTSITLGVSACMELFEQAAAAGSQMVVVHHGMFWKNESRVLKGHLKERVRFLLEHDLSLLAYHLPLDAHPRLGNNARIVRGLGASLGPPFGVYHGVSIGWSASFKKAVPLEEAALKLEVLTGSPPLVIRGGSAGKVKRLAVVSGGAGDIFTQAVEEGFDLYVTGEPYEPAQALCREAGIHFIALGHHNSERGGVKALAKWFEERFEIPARFVDVPNPA